MHLNFERYLGYLPLVNCSTTLTLLKLSTSIYQRGRVRERERETEREKKIENEKEVVLMEAGRQRDRKKER